MVVREERWLQSEGGIKLDDSSAIGIKLADLSTKLAGFSE